MAPPIRVPWVSTSSTVPSTRMISGQGVTAAGEIEVHHVSASYGGGQDQGGEAGVVGAEQGGVQQAEHPLVIACQGQQSVQSVTDLARQHGGFHAFAAHVSERDQRASPSTAAGCTS